ncbi:hypothetical protein MMC30_005458 [Trapelia coarctata]|nr:hypothetical protein [Trapelia coarctata]
MAMIAEEDADNAIAAYLQGREPVDERGTAKRMEERFLGWFLPKEQKGEKSRL